GAGVPGPGGGGQVGGRGDLLAVRSEEAADDPRAAGDLDVAGAVAVLAGGVVGLLLDVGAGLDDVVAGRLNPLGHRGEAAEAPRVGVLDEADAAGPVSDDRAVGDHRVGIGRGHVVTPFRHAAVVLLRSEERRVGREV